MNIDVSCALCGKPLKTEETVCVKAKGLATICRFSEAKSDNVRTLVQGRTEVCVHKRCRAEYIHERSVKPSKPAAATPVKTRLSGDGVLDCVQFCLYCTSALPAESTVSKNPTRHRDICTAGDVKSLAALRDEAAARHDRWGNTVFQRLDIAISGVVARRARYHKNCLTRFRDSPAPLTPSQPTASGRPTEVSKELAFSKLCDFLKCADECQFTLSEIYEMQKSFSKSGEVYSEKHLLHRLEDHFSDGRMRIYRKQGSQTILCFSGNSYDEIRAKFRANQNLKTEEEVRKFMEAAGSLARKEIREKQFDLDNFPVAHAVLNSQAEVPELLKILIESIVKPKSAVSVRKCIAAEHTILAATRPRSFVSSLYLPLAVYLHRRYGSRELIDVLHKLGICASYQEVEKYEASVSVACDVPIDADAFVQYVFDNADFNVRSIDGHGTFHCMGGIRIITPASSSPHNWVAPRKELPAPDWSDLAYLRIETYSERDIRGLLKVKVSEIPDFERVRSFCSVYALDVLHLSGPWLEVEERLGWSGFMSVAHSNDKFSTSEIQTLPFGNLSPSDPSTIFSCMKFSADECVKRGQKHCIVTFDQPLYVKAKEIVAASKYDWGVTMIIRLGGFHTLMSFMGAAGAIMSGSGLEDSWGAIYAKNSIPQMMNGHSYARALRAHILTQTALFTLLLNENLEMPINSMLRLRRAYCASLKGSFRRSEHPDIDDLQRKITEILKDASSSGRTSKLWLQYMDQITVVKDFLRSERSGDWGLHIESLTAMLPYFHAAGHLPYAKAAHMYLQDMITLEERMDPTDFLKFTEKGFFTVRRTDKFWAGVWTDMTIEQFLMSKLKSQEGLTHGRGLTASTIAKWVKSMPASAEIMDAIHTFCGVTSGTSEQHVELRDSRQARDRKDQEKIFTWFSNHSPFSKPPDLLVSLASGTVADETVNCDNAVACGLQAMKKMTGKSFGDLHLSRKDKVTSFAAMKKVVRINGENIPVTTNQLFHRIVCVIREEEDLRECFNYELAPHPPALFDDSGLMRKGTKSNLISVFKEQCDQNLNLPKKCRYVVDGGYLLHKVAWGQPSTFSDICAGYVSFLKRHYPSPIVVFDGYEHSTKDEEHLRRQGLAQSNLIDVQGVNYLTIPKAKFLSNPENKKNFISFLRNVLEDAQIKTHQSDSDADRLIIMTAIQAQKQSRTPVVVVGEDTDLVVLLAAIPTEETNIRMLIPPKLSREKSTVFSSRNMQSKLEGKANLMLFLHAFSGCDTSSAVYRKGKKHAFSKLMSLGEAELERLQVFNKKNADPDEIAQAGEMFMLSLYGAHSSEASLNTLRFTLYQRTIARQPLHAKFDLSSLPPTSAACRQHSFRVYLQVQQWLGNEDETITTWGWYKKSDGVLRPTFSTEVVAPETLLKLVYCSCRGNCDTLRCECKKAGLRCSSICGVCLGKCCANRQLIQDTEPGSDLPDSLESCTNK